MNQDLRFFSADSENRPDLSVVEQMETLARKYHAGQFRKDGKTPYFEHPVAVVARLRRWGAGESGSENDVVSLAVAWGHDLLEDTKITAGEILETGSLGERILAGIQMLTFAVPSDAGTKAQRDRKKAEYIRVVARTATPEILAVKIADRLCNTEDFFLGWGKDRALSYLAKGADLLENAHRLDPSFRAACENDIHALLVRLLDKNGDNASLIALLKTSIGR